MPNVNRTEISALPVNVGINTLIEDGARVEPERNSWLSRGEHPRKYLLAPDSI